MDARRHRAADHAGSPGACAAREDVEIDARSGERLSAECARAHVRRGVARARWTVLASRWLNVREREASTLPPLASDCVDDGRAATATLHIEGVRDRAVLTSGDGGAVRVEVRALGTSDPVNWLLGGRLVSQVRGDTVAPLRLDAAGDHELTAVVEAGA